MWMRPLLGCLSPAGPRARLSILIFHRVLAQPDPLFPDEMDAARFDAVCGWVRRWFNVLPLPEAHRRLQQHTLPARALAITFDDGYADNHDVALPILQRHGLSATFFVATGFIDGGVMWNDRIIDAVRRTACAAVDFGALGVPGLERLPLDSPHQRRQAIDAVLPAVKHLDLAARQLLSDRIVAALRSPVPCGLMMTLTQVHALHAAGQTIGAHTVHHPILATLDDAAARAEIGASRSALEAIVQAPVDLFAYPNGRPDDDYSAATVRLVREAGFAAAVTTAKGSAQAGTDPFQLPRFTPWDRSRMRYGLRLGANLQTPARYAS